MVNAWEEYKKNLGDTRPWDLVNPNTPRADSEDAEARLSICKLCPELVKITNQCKKCGCFMTVKTKLEAAKCPIGKW